MSKQVHIISNIGKEDGDSNFLQWYMNEISNREQQINELRIQAIRDKSGMQREITLLNERNNELAYSNEQFTKQLAEREKELAEVQEKFRQVMDENTARIGELETELRTWERLSNVYKEASQAAEKEIEELRESEARLEALLKDKEEGLLLFCWHISLILALLVIQEIALELEQSKEKHAAEIKAKGPESDEVKLYFILKIFQTKKSSDSRMRLPNPLNC